MSSEAQRAVQEVAAGDPGRAARGWLGVVTLVLLALFAINTVVVFTEPVLLVERPAELAVQRFPFGPLSQLMEATNWLGGIKQPIVGALVVLVLTLLERRAGYLMALGFIGSLIGQGLKLFFARDRPGAGLVHILDPAAGYSYPSGHAVFYTWLAFMFAFAVAPKLPRAYRWLAWLGATVVILTACLGRVWAGDHWPSDVVGGFLLGLGWSTFVLWMPERFLPEPNFRRLGGLGRFVRRPS